MAKPKKRTKKTQKSTPPPPAPVASELEPIGRFADQWPHWRLAYWGVMVVFLLFSLVLSFQIGVNADEAFQDDYSEKLVDYYLSAGQDTSALYIEKGNMHLYGGLYETVAGTTNRVLGFTPRDHAYHHVRHVLIVICAFFIVFFTSMWVRRLGGWPAALIAALLLWVAPRFTGHGLMNPKDIPFALGFAMHFYYLSVLLQTMPKPSWRTVIGAAAGIMIAIGLRSAGILLICYLGLFFLLHWWQQRKVTGSTPSLVPYLKYGAIIAVAGYVLAILFWPYALQSPIDNVLESFSAQSEFAIRIRLLFMGKIWFSDATPWYYPVLGLLKTVPLHTWLGVIAFLFGFNYIRKRIGNLQAILPLFVFLFPLVYLSIQNPNLYSGWRHILFVHPGMVAVAALGWVYVLGQVYQQVMYRRVTLGVLGVLLLVPLIHMVRNGSLMYIYFNMLNFGPVVGNYELDYWGVSTRQAVEWMEDEGILPPAAGDTIRIVSNYSYSMNRWIRNDYGSNVKTGYVRYRQMRAADWDYAIMINHFINGGYLKDGRFPPTGTIKTFYVNNMPIAAIIKRDAERYTYQAAQAAKARRWAEADSLYQLAVAQDATDVEAWEGKAQANLQLQQFGRAAEAAQQAVNIDADNVNYHQLLGITLLNQGDAAGAERSFRKALAIYPGLSTAHYYLGQLAYAQKNYSAAVRELEAAIESQPNLAQAYLLMSQVYEAMGDTNTAQQYQQLYNQLRGGGG